jgi:threonylcarbamoyladenosine tRNA methylthiotransferase MtaB
MPPVPAAVIKERAGRLRQAGEAALSVDLKSRIGSETDVLIERSGKGRASFYAAVEFTKCGKFADVGGLADGGEVGTVQRMRLVDSDRRSLVGVAVE